MEKIKVAFATDDGKHFIKRHFGDAYYYDIYEISVFGNKFIKRINNTSEEDDKNIHGDPKKAKGIVDLLKHENVQVAASKIFGPNINKIKVKFVCVLLDDEQISDSFKTIQKNINIIINEWGKGEIRGYINLKNHI